MYDTETLEELRNLLKEIKEKPGLYLGSKSLIKFRMFIDGFLYGLYVKSGKQKYYGFFPGFQEWIANRFDIKTAHSWDSIISFFSIDDSQAFDKFYELFEEFLQEKN